MPRAWLCPVVQQGRLLHADGACEHPQVVLMLVPPQVNGVLLDMTGFHTLRNEFEPEHDNAAESSMAELEFREDDSEVRLHVQGIPACSVSCIYPGFDCSEEKALHPASHL